MQTLQLAAVGGHKEHVAAAQEPIRTGYIQNDATVGLAGNGKGNARREVGLNQTRNYVNRRALRGNNQVDAHGAGHLRQPADMFFHFLRRRHHQIGHFVHNHDDIGQRLFVALGQIFVVAHQVTCAHFAAQSVAALHLLHGPKEHASRLIDLSHDRAEQVRDAIVECQLDHFGVNHQEAQVVGRIGQEQTADN